MKPSKLRAAAAIGALAALLSACGGNVNLGGKGSQPSGVAGAPQSPDEIASTTGERVLERSDFFITELVLAGDYLYFVHIAEKGGIFRCRKADCEATLEVFVSGNAGYPRAFGDRLGFTRWENDDSYGFSSVALSNAMDEQVVIRGLPDISAVPPLYSPDFVFFSLVDDRSLYRCSQPTCADNPKRLTGTASRSAITPSLDADRLIWCEGSFIYRAAGYGTEPAIALLPDDMLSEAPAAVSNADEPPPERVTTIDVSDGMLYARILRAVDGKPCEQDCSYDVVAWPVLGGASRNVFSGSGRLENLRVFDHELVWTRPTEGGDYFSATVSTCRVEACEATRRDLGESQFGGYAVVAADEHDVYWLEAEPSTTTDVGAYVWPNQIRRAPRLPAP